MNSPNWKKCTEEELWKFVGFYLAEAGVESVLVGGAVVAIYSKGAFKSGDLDFVTQSGTQEKVREVLEALGFKKTSRHYEHPECQHLFIEFPIGPLSIGDDYKIKPNEVNVEGKTIKIFSPTDCVRDRLASYIHFNARECLDQAVLVAQNKPVNLKKIEEWCKSERATEAFDEFKTKLKMR